MAPNVRKATLRQSIQGNLTDFVMSAGFSDARVTNLCCDIVHSLSSYREEDVQLFPEVFILDGIDGNNSIAEIAPGSEMLFLGSEKWETLELSKLVLKKCANLSRSGWSTLIIIREKVLEFGLFRSIQLPISISTIELVSSGGITRPVIGIRNCATNAVTLHSGKTGDLIEFHLSSIPENGPFIRDEIERLSNAICTQVPEEIQKDMKAYFRRLLEDSLRASHGTLVAVMKEVSGELAFDGVCLANPIEFVSAFTEVRNSSTADSLSRLQSLEVLFRGMICSDGITILRPNASICAYSVFIKPDKSDESEFDLKVTGGARSRAFELMKKRVGSIFNCVLFRSQDGKTDCVGSIK